ncbi:Meiotic recombination protein REC114 like protein [Argiope bruennichi]|uniref:Meiotic recombination protein REC114 like protein n=1 Tax=Argiope bruennichi TaxID=94029 RepID=A0A8T0FU71_ARGBR|nr:Meiotic recombination protein REC114 like protein [Argiope bruennichi]
MAASVKCKWLLKRCAKFLFEQDLNNPENQDEEIEDLDVSCKGAWKLYDGEHNYLVLSYLESDHFLLTKKDIILESFSLPCSKSCLKGVAKADTLLMSCMLQVVFCF